MKENIYESEKVPIIAITRETAIDWTFTLAYNKPVVFGQFLQVSLPGFGEAPISISDADDTTLTMTIRKVGQLTNEIFNKTVGDFLFVRGPYGNGFNVNNFKGKDLIVIAGGTGLAPVRGFIRYFATHSSFAQSVAVIAGFKSSADILFKSDLAEWDKSISLIATVDKGDGSWNGYTGLVTQYIPTITSVKNPNALAVVVGPPMMMKFATLALIEQGMRPEQITVSFERNMSCGAGKCGHCKIDSTYVCIDGPVFSYDKAKHLID
jgi:anaerobic sulfite reductase subunit B